MTSLFLRIYELCTPNVVRIVILSIYYFKYLLLQQTSRRIKLTSVVFSVEIPATVVYKKTATTATIVTLVVAILLFVLFEQYYDNNCYYYMKRESKRQLSERCSELSRAHVAKATGTRRPRRR